MRTKILFVLILLLLIGKMNKAIAQSQQKAMAGIGVGLDYGGIGVKAEFQPVKYLGVFGGFGYNLASPAYNAGLSFKLTPGKKVIPILTAMYGYNAAIKVKYAYGNTEAKTYYGPSIAAGCELYNSNGTSNLTLEICLPFRSSAFHNDYDAFKDAGVEFNPEIKPLTLTIGYNFLIGSKKNKK